MQWTDPVVVGRQIRLLDDSRFVELMNALVSETAAKHGIDRSCIATNINIKEPDGGIDARCVNAPTTAGRLIPSPNVDYQFKGGANKKSLSAIVDEDIRAKPRVLEGLQQGHAFVFVAAWDRGDAVEDDLAKKLRDAGISVQDGQLIFITGDTVARLLQDYPGLVARFLGWDMPLVDIEEWSSFRSLSNPFQSDESLRSTMATLRTEIGKPASITRIVGAAGNGKTRLVKETLRSSDLAASVLYAKQVDEVTPALVAHLRRTPGIKCTLVIDEVDDANADLLTDRFSAMPPGVRLVMIGLDASGRAPKGTLQVEGLNETLLKDAILAVVPGLSEDTAASIARDCARSPKLAVLIAGRIKEDPTLATPYRLLSDGHLLNALDRYLDIDPNSPSWKAISVTALLMRLGWSEDAEVESEILFRAVDLDPTEARRHVQLLHERYGIAPAANRLRYVSPAILADHLAARQLGSWTRDRLTAVLSALTPAMAESMARRVRRMHSALENRKVVEEVILGDQGPFRGLEDLEQGHISVLLRHLAAPFRSATLNALRRVISNATIDQLRAATKSRRELVWALEELLWPEDTFEAAADLLLRLAIAENEKLGNNASQIWVSAFQTILGRTAAGPVIRARVIQRAATHSDSRARQFAADAIGAALKSEHLHRSGMPPTDVEGIPTEEWHPATYREWSDALSRYLTILPELLSDSAEDVRRSAAGALAAGLHTVATLPAGAFEQWTKLARTLIGCDYELREPVLSSMEWNRNRLNRLLKGDVNGNGDSESEKADDDKRRTIHERLGTLEELAKDLQGTDFSSRFRLYMDSSIWRNMALRHDDEGKHKAQRQLEEFATEAIQDPPLLEKEWKWLLSDKKWRGVERFIEVLGRIDSTRVFASALRDLGTQSPRAAMWFSLYEMSHAQALHQTDYLNSRIREMQQEGVAPTQIFDLLYRSGYEPSRLSIVVELIKTERLPPEYVNQLAYHPWGAAVPPLEALQLAEVAEIKAKASDTIIPYVSNYLAQVSDARPLFKQLALKLLLSPNREPNPQIYPIDEWVELAHKFTDQAPIELTAAALNRIGEFNLYHATEYIDRVLKPAWDSGDKRKLFLEVFAAFITRTDLIGWHLRQELESFPFDDLGAEFLIEWVSKDPKNRAHHLADVIGPPIGRPSDLHAILLEKFDAEGVGSAYAAQFMTGSHVGSSSNWIRGKLEQAKQWLTDERPVIAEWANRLVRSLEKDLQRELAREEEEHLLY
jgi:hypothetical protein